MENIDIILHYIRTTIKQLERAVTNVGDNDGDDDDGKRKLYVYVVDFGLHM